MKCQAETPFISSMASKLLNLLFFLILLPKLSSSTPKPWIRAGYYYSGNEFPVTEINSKLFTHLLCAFAYINYSTYQLSINSSTLQKFSTFTNIVQRQNPSIISLISIWVGREQSSIFYVMLNHSTYRKAFIESSIKSARINKFHGIDLCGILPYNSLAMTNLGTLLLNEWRIAVASESRNSGLAELLLVMSSFYLPMGYPIKSMQRNLDWVHVLAYDYHLPKKENFTNFHAPLFGPLNQINTDYGIKEWLRSGFPANKLVLGLPYHGYAWMLDNPKENMIGSPAIGPAVTLDGSMAYKLIKWYIQNLGYGAVSVFNATYVVNYCTIASTWINYDDVEAIKTKVSYARKKGLIGYNVFQVGNDYNWVLSRAAQEAAEDRQMKHWSLLIIIILPTSLFVLILGSIICYLQLIKRALTRFKDDIKSLASKLNAKIFRSLNNNSPNLVVFTFTNIKSATNNFSSENKLGEGGFGPVYKGKLLTGQEIAVKRLSKTSSQGLEELKNEITVMGRLQHVNLVRLLGYCTEREEKMLIYECMPKKSLDLYLFDPMRRCVLDWKKRIHIIEGVTQGLLYLQEYSNFTIIHRDLKASNILLDDEMNPKISDFGLARIFQKDVHTANTRRIVGTYGCIPPEYIRKGIYSMKYDIYSFGVLLLQIISGKRNTSYYGIHQNLSLLEYAYDLWKEGKSMEFMDPSLDDWSSSSCKLTMCLQVALLCVQENPMDRPSMLEVYSMLKSETTDFVVCPNRPAFSIVRDQISGEDHKNMLGEHICSVNLVTVSDVVPR